jgi:hypothetical protein
MKASTFVRAGVVALAASTGTVLHAGERYGMDENGWRDMMHQMEEVQKQGRMLRDARPGDRDRLLGEHRHGMMSMMRMMHRMGDHMDEHMMDGDDDMSSRRSYQRDMGRRMDMVENMMSEMLDHMDIYEQDRMHR